MINGISNEYMRLGRWCIWACPSGSRLHAWPRPRRRCWHWRTRVQPDDMDVDMSSESSELDRSDEEPDPSDEDGVTLSMSRLTKLSIKACRRTQSSALWCTNEVWHQESLGRPKTHWLILRGQNTRSPTSMRGIFWFVHACCWEETFFFKTANWVFNVFWCQVEDKHSAKNMCYNRHVLPVNNNWHAKFHVCSFRRQENQHKLALMVVEMWSVGAFEICLSHCLWADVSYAEYITIRDTPRRWLRFRSMCVSMSTYLLLCLKRYKSIWNCTSGHVTTGLCSRFLCMIKQS